MISSLVIFGATGLIILIQNAKGIIDDDSFDDSLLLSE
jgi:hypothetical protein